MNTPGNLMGLLGSSRVVVLLGPGGVGKTTTAIITALLGAKMGKRVALLSIDPARRLAAALGIPLGDQLRSVVIPPDALPASWRSGAAVDGGLPGRIDAAMLDQKAVFDAMVRSSAPSAEVTAKILAHPIYKAASANLAGPLEYMALAKLQDLAENSDYDLVVLDTPPDTHALDFLARPNVLAGFMENKVMSWLIKPFLMATKFGLGRILNTGERLMGGVARITGVSALHNFGDFLLLMQEVIDGFNRSGQKIVELLHRQDTTFLLVSVPTLAAGRGLKHLSEQLVQMGYAVSGVIFNRCLPTDVEAALAAFMPEQMDAATRMVGKRAMGERQVKDDLRQYFTSASPPVIVSIADQESEIGNLPSLMRMAEHFAVAAS